MVELLTQRKIDERVIDSFPEIDPKFPAAFAKLTNPDIYEEFTYKDMYNDTSTRFIFNSHILEFEKKFKVLLGDFLPKDTRCFIAGGSVLTYILYGNELFIRDFDIFTSTQDENTRIELFLRKENQSAVIVENDNTKHFSIGGIEIDLIKKPFENIETLFNHFDIDVCKVGIEVNNHNFTFKKGDITFAKIFSRRFSVSQEKFLQTNFNKNGDGIKLFKRIVKYCSKGLHPSQSVLTNFYANLLLSQNKELENKSEKEKNEIKEKYVKDLEKTLEKDYQFVEDKTSSHSKYVVMS